MTNDLDDADLSTCQLIQNTAEAQRALARAFMVRPEDFKAEQALSILRHAEEHLKQLVTECRGP